MLNKKNWANWPTIAELERAAEGFLGSYRVGVEYKGNGQFFYQMEVIYGCPWSPDVDIEEGIFDYLTVYHMWLDLEEWTKNKGSIPHDLDNELPF